MKSIRAKAEVSNEEGVLPPNCHINILPEFPVFRGKTATSTLLNCYLNCLLLWKSPIFLNFLNKLRSVFHNMERFSTVFPLIFFYSKDSVTQLLNHVWLFANPWTEAHQAPLSFTISWSLLKFISIELVSPLFMWFPRQDYWSGLSLSSPGDLPNSGIKPTSPILQADSLPLSHHRRFYLAPLDFFDTRFPQIISKNVPL